MSLFVFYIPDLYTTWLSSVSLIWSRPKAPLSMYPVSMDRDLWVLSSWPPIFRCMFLKNCDRVFCFLQFPGVLAYCMSKSAIDQFTRCIALGKSFFSPYCMLTIVKGHNINSVKINIFQNWQVSKSEWTLYGEWFNENCISLCSVIDLFQMLNSYIS